MKTFWNWLCSLFGSKPVKSMKVDMSNVVPITRSEDRVAMGAALESKQTNNIVQAKLIQALQIQMAEEDKRGGEGMSRSDWVKLWNKQTRAGLKKAGYFIRKDKLLYVNRRKFEREFGDIILRANRILEERLKKEEAQK